MTRRVFAPTLFLMTGTTRRARHRPTTFAEAAALSAVTAAVDAALLLAWARTCRRAREGRTR